jgi:hypothetical protein
MFFLSFYDTYPKVLCRECLAFCKKEKKKNMKKDEKREEKTKKKGLSLTIFLHNRENNTKKIKT